MSTRSIAPFFAAICGTSRSLLAGLVVAGVGVLAGCGGGGAGSGGNAANTNAASATSGDSATVTTTAAPTVVPSTVVDATRLAQQATFGPTEALVQSMVSQGVEGWLADQFATAGSRYARGGGADVHQWSGTGNYCDGKASTCWRDNFSAEPLLWDFYRNALGNADQLRQRVAFALSQIVVISDLEVTGTYGLRRYQNMLLDSAFGNYGDLLKAVTKSPVMGDYLGHVNNQKAAPNENYARELLQLFSTGTCLLNADGRLQGGTCQPVYDNQMVRSYAYALTGWTYPSGGRTAWGCWPAGANCRFYDGDMVPVASFHDTTARTLLSGESLPAGHSVDTALDAVIRSVMAHGNVGPFIGRQLIQHLVSSNPSAGYVQRVAAAFDAGRYQGPSRTFGAGRKGDLTATVAAVLLDAEARATTAGPRFGKLREPVLHMTGVLRALGGRSDGEALSWWWGGVLRQHVFKPPNVFSYFPPDFPLAGQAGLQAPTFALHNASTALGRLNYLHYLLFWGGTAAADSTVPEPLGTSVDVTPFVADAADAGKLVDRLAVLATGAVLPASQRTLVMTAVNAFNASTDRTNWQTNRVRQAAYLVFASPAYQVQR